jgi:uncharacterized Zn finger protein
MARARLHIICGNCGCDDEFKFSVDLEGNDWGDGTFSPEVYIHCANCGTLHSLSSYMNERGT